MSWQDKITALRAKMRERKINWFVATALDEIACRFFIFLLRLIKQYKHLPKTV
jgi:hypothetical protein